MTTESRTPENNNRTELDTSQIIAERARILGAYMDERGGSALPTPDKNLIPIDGMSPKDQQRLGELREMLAGGVQEKSSETQELLITETDIQELRHILDTIDPADNQRGRLEGIFESITAAKNDTDSLIEIRAMLQKHILELEEVASESESYGEDWMVETVDEAYYNFARKFDQIIDKK